MTVFDSDNIIHYERIETECPQCGYSRPRDDLCETGKLALIETTEYVRSITELRLLRRTRDLFERHPHSKHPIIVHQMLLKIVPEPDPALDEELDRDQELKKFLNGFSFYLPARLASCEKTEPKEPPAVSDRDDIACPECSHFLILPEQFFFRVGLQVPPGKQK